MNALRIELFPEAEVPRHFREQVVALQDHAWPGEEPSGVEPWHDPALMPRSMLLVGEDGRVLVALDILSKELEHAGERWSASGLAAVVTDPAERGRGLGRTLVAAARDVIASSGVDVGLFTSDRGLRTFYERAGWEHLPGTVLVGGTAEDPFPSNGEGFDKVTIGGFFTARAHARHTAFIGARIDLYPGAIDRLW